MKRRISEDETPQQYFNKIRKHHKDKSGEYKNYPIDLQLVRIEQFKEDGILRCGYCNSSYMEDSITPYECRKCWEKRLSRYLDEKSIKELYNEIMGIKTTGDDLPF